MQRVYGIIAVEMDALAEVELLVLVALVVMLWSMTLLTISRWGRPQRTKGHPSGLAFYYSALTNSRCAPARRPE